LIREDDELIGALALQPITQGPEHGQAVLVDSASPAQFRDDTDAHVFLIRLHSRRKNTFNARFTDGNGVGPTAMPLPEALRAGREAFEAVCSACRALRT